MGENLKWYARPQFTSPLLVLFVAVMLEIGKGIAANGNYGTQIYFVISIIQIVAFLFPCALYYILKGKKLASPMLISPLKIGHILFLVFAFLLFSSGTILIKYLAYVIYGGTAGMSTYIGTTVADSPENSVGIIMAVVVVPAVCEELFFRGVLLAEYRACGSVNAIIASSLFFALLHFSFENLLLYFFAGLVLGLTASATRSVLAPIIIHAGANALALFGSDSYIRLTVLKCGPFFVGFVLACIFALSLLLTVARLETVYYRFSEAPPSDLLPPASRKFVMQVFFSPTFILLLASLVVITIYF